jgi:hypothetical protein
MAPGQASIDAAIVGFARTPIDPELYVRRRFSQISKKSGPKSCPAASLPP